MRFSPARLTVLLCAIACLVLPSTSYALDAGDVAPPVHAVSVLGGRPVPFDLRAALRHHAVVLYFFPKAFSQGWTIEAKAYAARLADFEKLGATVIGISPDDVDTLARFQKSTAAPQRFVSDHELRVAAAYGAKMTEGGDTFAKRQTFIIGANGKILYSVFDWSPLSNMNKVYGWLKAHPQH